MRKKQGFEENNIINFGEGCWGMNISFLDDGYTNWKKQTRISGHYPYRSKIKKGTLLIKKCSLGYLYLRVKKVEYCRDPDDMFFANVIYIRNDKMLSKEEHKYLEDNNLYNYCN